MTLKLFLKVRIGISKTNQYGKPVCLNIPAIQNEFICPVNTMQRYLSARGFFPGNLFCHSNSSPLTRYQFSAVLSKAISHAGLSSQHYKSHSFRIGRATSLAIAGVSSEEIKKLGSENQFKFRLISVESSVVWLSRYAVAPSPVSNTMDQPTCYAKDDSHSRWWE